MALLLLTPTMTSNTTPSGVAALDYQGSVYHAAWGAFDRADPRGARFGNEALMAKNPPHWLSYDFGVPQRVTHYRLQGIESMGVNCPKDFSLQGWDGSDWVVLHTVAGLARLTSLAWTPTYTIDTPGYYQAYRLYVTDWWNTSSYPDWFDVTELELLAPAPEYSPPTAEIDIAANSPMFVSGAYAVAWSPAEIEVAAGAPSLAAGVTVAAPGILEVLANALNYIWTPPQQSRWTVVYRCTLTGATDGLADLVLPIESYQARLRSGTPSFVSVVVPDGPALAAGIAARANGELVIERGVRFADGSMQLAELTRVDLESISSARGGRNWSVTLSGHATTTTSVPKTLTLQGVSYLATGSGSRRARAAMDLNLRPGDTAVAAGVEIVVGLISHTVSSAGETMEITEAVA